MKYSQTVQNKSNQTALKLIEQISAQGLDATPIIYEAFF